MTKRPYNALSHKKGDIVMDNMNSTDNMDKRAGAVPKEGKRTLAAAVAGYAFGLAVMVAAGYDVFGHAPAPVYSFFSVQQPLEAFATDFAGELRYVLASFVIAMIPVKQTGFCARNCVYAPLFARAAFCGFSSVYFYGTHPDTGIYIVYAVSSAMFVFFHACIALRLSVYRSSGYSEKHFSSLIFQIMFFTGFVVIVMLLKNALIFLLG